MAQMETEKSGYGGLERFLYLFFIPVVFTVILTVVLLSMFGYNVMDSVLRAANKVPLLEYVVPDPKDKPSDALNVADQTSKDPAKEDELNEKIRLLEEELEQGQLAIQSKQEQVQQLETEISDLQQLLADTLTAQSEAAEEIKTLAKVYAEMTPSKAAPVLAQMGIDERMLVLGQMKPSDQKRILEKMDPAIAAETSLQQIAQVRGETSNVEDKPSQALDMLSADEVSRTIAGMNPNSAAKLLLEMTKINEKKALQILRGMDVQSRSVIMTELSNASEATAAQLAAKLGG